MQEALQSRRICSIGLSYLIIYHNVVTNKTFYREIYCLYSERLGRDRRVGDIIFNDWWLIVAILSKYKGYLRDYQVVREYRKREWIRSENRRKFFQKFKCKPKIVIHEIHHYHYYNKRF